MVKTNQRIEHLDTKLQANNKGEVRKPRILKLIRFGFGTLGRIFPGIAGNLAIKLFGTPGARAKHKASDDIIKASSPFSFESLGLQLKGYEWGKGEETILLVHGWGSRGTALRSFVPGLIQQGFKVITFDAPAHGDSPGKYTNIVDYAEAITAVIKEKGSVYGIITHSFGGAATVYAFHKTNPELSAEKLVLIASPKNISDPINEAVNVLNLSPKVAQKLIQKIEHILGATIQETTLANSAAVVNFKEVLIVHDQKDKTVTFSSAESNFAAFENASLITTKGLGHYLLMKNEQVIQRVTQFISS